MQEVYNLLFTNNNFPLNITEDKGVPAQQRTLSKPEHFLNGINVTRTTIANRGRLYSVCKGTNDGDMERDDIDDHRSLHTRDTKCNLTQFAPISHLFIVNNF